MEEYERRKRMMSGAKKAKKPVTKPKNAEPKDGERRCRFGFAWLLSAAEVHQQSAVEMQNAN